LFHRLHRRLAAAADGRGHGFAGGLARGRQGQLPREGEARLEQAQGLAPRAPRLTAARLKGPRLPPSGGRAR